MKHTQIGFDHALRRFVFIPRGMVTWANPDRQTIIDTRNAVLDGIRDRTGARVSDPAQWLVTDRVEDLFTRFRNIPAAQRPRDVVGLQELVRDQFDGLRQDLDEPYIRHEITKEIFAIKIGESIHGTVVQVVHNTPEARMIAAFYGLKGVPLDEFVRATPQF